MCDICGINSIPSNFACILIRSKCEDVVLLKVGDQLKGKEEVYCSRCFCKYENRNTTIIKVSARLILSEEDCGIYSCFVFADSGDTCYLGYIPVSDLYVVLNLLGSVTKQKDP